MAAGGASVAEPCGATTVGDAGSVAPSEALWLSVESPSAAFALMDCSSDASERTPEPPDVVGDQLAGITDAPGATLRCQETGWEVCWREAKSREESALATTEPRCLSISLVGRSTAPVIAKDGTITDAGEVATRAVFHPAVSGERHGIPVEIELMWGCAVSGVRGTEIAGRSSVGSVKFTRALITGPAGG